VPTGAGAGASTLGAGAGSSAFLHPITESDKEATNSIAIKMANIFFIIGKPPFKDLIKGCINITSPYIGGKNTSFFCLVKQY
jgi:hypothetical protein